MGSLSRVVVFCVLSSGCTGQVGAPDACDTCHDDPCVGRTCSGHGTCGASGGTAACACDPGYEPNGFDCVQSQCTPASHASSRCEQGNVYWYDSCGLRQEMRQSCNGLGCSGAQCVPPGCNPTNHASSACYQGDVYWYDSCGKLQEIKSKCGAAGCSAGACIERLAVTPSQHAFGTVAINQSTGPFVFTVTNEGSGSATNVSLSAGTGSEFVVSANTCGTTAAKVSLAAGGSCTFAVAFAPASAGSKPAVFTITYDLSGASGQTATVSVSGVGMAAGETITAHGITFPNAHPRLWFNDPARLARAKAYFAAHPYSPSGSDAQDIIDIALMHVVNGYNCASAIQWAVNFQTASGYVPKPNDAGSDQVRNNGEALVLVYDWCHDQLTDSQRAKYVVDWNLWFGNVKQQTWGGSTGNTWMSENNYFWGNLRNEMEWGIATYNENADADSFLGYAVDQRWAGAAEFFKDKGRGGVCSEGMDYGATLLQYPLIPFVTAVTGGRDVFAEADRFSTAVYWLIYAGLPAKTYNAGTKQTDWQWFTFSDDEHAFWTGDRQRVMYFGDFMAEAVNLWPGSTGRYAQAWLDRVTPNQTKVTQADVNPVTPANFADLPLDFYGSGYGYYYGRSGWGNAATVFHLQLELPGSETGHYHWDAGNFQLWRNGRWLTREATGYALSIPDYNNVGQTSVSYGIAHNLPLVNGLGPMGWHWRAAGPGVVRRLESRGGYSYAEVGLTDVFQGKSDHPEYINRALVSLERELVFVRSLETMVVLDRIEMASPDGGSTPATSVKGTFVLHTETTPTVQDANHLLVVNGSQAMRVTTLIPTAGGTYRQIAEPKTFTTRSELDYAGGSASACNSGHSCIYQLNVLQARDPSASDLAASLVDSSSSNPLSGSLTVTLHPSTGGDVVLVFRKGMQSAGGSIAINGSEAALRNDVQPIRYTENGPVWQ